MAILVIFLINSGLNFLLGLILAKVLGPDQFGRYAVAMSVAVLVNGVVFDWVRLSAARFYSDTVREQQPKIRATLDLLVSGASFGTFAVLLALIFAGVDLRIPPLLAGAAAATGVAMALFDFAMTLTRARFLNRTYTIAVIIKNGAAFTLMIGMAIQTGDPVIVLCASAVSSALALIVIRRVLRDDGADVRNGEWGIVKQFARYGVPLMLANMFYLLMTFVSRAMIVDSFGYAEAGQFALAADLGQRVFSTLGSAVDILLFQLAVRADEKHGSEQARAQVDANFSKVLMLLAPLAAGYWMVLPAFEATLVPQAFQGPFAAYSQILTPALFMFGLVLYGFNSTFQIARRTYPVVVAAAGAMIVNIMTAYCLAPYLGPIAFAWAQLAGYAMALVLIIGLAARFAPIRVNWRDVSLILLATAVMVGVLWPMRSMPPGAALLLGMMATGFAVYSAIVVISDTAGIRAFASALITRRRLQSQN
ncbi:MAG: lipopolysaccharide biosynthesis protein [Beijerinckiaceae bacterium]